MYVKLKIIYNLLDNKVTGTVEQGSLCPIPESDALSLTLPLTALV